jgi:hypothetical protein
MKVRNGFVSNSSSSSFMIVSKNGELTEEKIIKAFDVKEGTPLYVLSKGISTDIIRNSEKYSREDFINEYTWKSMTDEEFEEEFEEDYPEEYELFEKSKTDGWNIYFGSADSYDEPILCELELFYEDEDIIIKKSGGY